MGLMPVGGGDGGAREELARACHFCAEPSAGPCAWCRLPICGRGDCSVVVEERGLRPVVLCRDCAGARPASARWPWLPAVPALLGIAMLAATALWGRSNLLAGISSLVGAMLVLSAGVGLWSRARWRRRLGRARGRDETP